MLPSSVSLPRCSVSPFLDEGRCADANLCGTDEEGFSLPEGRRSGWNFSLHSRFDTHGAVDSAGVHAPGEQLEENPLVPHGRVLTGGMTSGAQGMSGEFYVPIAGAQAAERLAFADEDWHHVAWQWRRTDQAQFLFIDSELVWSSRPPMIRAVPPGPWARAP